MEKNRIKLAILESKYYGAVTSVNDLVVRLDKERFDVTFLYLSGDPGRENHLQQAGYKVCYLSRSERMPVFRPDVLVKLIRFLRRNQIDLLHCHAHKATQYGAIAGIFAPKVKIIAHVHGLGRFERLRRKLAFLLFAWRINRFLAVAKAVKQDILQSNWRIPASKIEVLENSVDYERFASAKISKSQARQMLNIPQKAFVFGTIGRLAPMKGQQYMIEAMALIKNDMPNSHLLIIGDGPLRQVLQEQVHKSRLEERVHFTGKRADVEKCIQAMDAFVLSSVASEGMPRALLEAMAGGIPPIVTDLSGMAEMIDKSDLGFVVKPGDSHAVANAMIQMMRKSPQEITAMAEMGEKKVREQYSHTVVMEKLKNIYLEIVGIMDQ